MRLLINKLILNYKDLFHIAILLISSPARAWEEISLEDRRKVFTTFVYPMIGLCGLSVFIGSLMKMGWDGPQSFQYAMTQCCAVAVSLFGGYFLAAYLINGLRVRMFMLDSDIPLAQQFAGYALVVVFMLRIVIGILPDFGIMALLLQFYIVYVVWEGSKKVMQIAEKDRLRFTILSSILLIACPVAIEWIFRQLGMGLLVGTMDIATANNTVAIVMANPIAKEMSEDYDITPRKAASLLDTFSCIFQGIIPYGAQMLVAISAVSELGYSITAFQILPKLFYPMFLFVSSLIWIYVIPEGKSKTKA